MSTPIIPFDLSCQNFYSHLGSAAWTRSLKSSKVGADMSLHVHFALTCSKILPSFVKIAQLQSYALETKC